MNFEIIGFTTEPTLKEICNMIHRTMIPLLDNLGSGSLIDTSKYNIAHEPMVQESIEAGADLVCFPSDKLLGGPQAGIVVGRENLIDKLKKHPLTRAIRADKIALAALSTTHEQSIMGESEDKIPVCQMISSIPKLLYKKTVNWKSNLEVGKVIAGQSTMGGGGLSGEASPTWLLALAVSKLYRFLSTLLQSQVPIIACIKNNLVIFDPCIILPEKEYTSLHGIQHALENVQ